MTTNIFISSRSEVKRFLLLPVVLMIYHILTRWRWLYHDRLSIIYLCDRIIRFKENFWLDFPGGSDGKASAYNVGDLGSILVLGSSPGEGNGNPLQYSCLESPIDGGAWWATVRGVTKSQTRLSDFTFFSFLSCVMFGELGWQHTPAPAPPLA